MTKGKIDANFLQKIRLRWNDGEGSCCKVYVPGLGGTEISKLLSSSNRHGTWTVAVGFSTDQLKWIFSSWQKIKACKISEYNYFIKPLLTLILKGEVNCDPIPDCPLIFLNHSWSCSWVKFTYWLIPDWQTLTDWLNGIENNKDDWKSLTEDCKSLVVDCKSLTDDCQSLTDNCKSLTDDCKSLPDWLKNTS